MKKIKPFIVVIVFFLMLIGFDLISRNLYFERSSQSLEQCYERSDQRDICRTLRDTANSAYTSATASHIFTYLVIFLVFWFLTLRIEGIGKRLKELEGRSDV